MAGVTLESWHDQLDDDPGLRDRLRTGTPNQVTHILGFIPVTKPPITSFGLFETRYIRDVTDETMQAFAKQGRLNYKEKVTVRKATYTFGKDDPSEWKTIRFCIFCRVEIGNIILLITFDPF